MRAQGRRHPTPMLSSILFPDALPRRTENVMTSAGPGSTQSQHRPAESRLQAPLSYVDTTIFSRQTTAGLRPSNTADLGAEWLHRVQHLFSDQQPELPVNPYIRTSTSNNTLNLMQRTLESDPWSLGYSNSSTETLELARRIGGGALLRDSIDTLPLYEEQDAQAAIKDLPPAYVRETGVSFEDIDLEDGERSTNEYSAQHRPRPTNDARTWPGDSIRHADQSQERTDENIHPLNISTRTTSSRKGTKTIIVSDSLASNPERLHQYLKQQARIMPRPILTVNGRHWEETCNSRGKKINKIVHDFHLKLDLSQLFVSQWRRSRLASPMEETFRGGRSRTRGVDIHAASTRVEMGRAETGTLEEWCHQSCAKGGIRKFHLARQISGLDVPALSRNAYRAIRVGGYNGQIHMGYKIDDRSIVVMSNGFINRCRNNAWVWWTCVILQLWIVIWPFLLLRTRKWKVVKVDWPCRITEDVDINGLKEWPNMDEEDANLVWEGRSVVHPPGTRIAVMSEEEFVHSQVDFSRTYARMRSGGGD